MCDFTMYSNMPELKEMGAIEGYRVVPDSGKEIKTLSL
jgi:hypothetical protein